MSWEYAIVNQYITRTRGASGTPPPLPPPKKKEKKKEPNFHINKENKIKDKIVIQLLKLN